VNRNGQLAESGNVSHLQLAQVALKRYALEDATLTLISEVENAIYKVTVPADSPTAHHPYLGRVSGQQLLLRIEESVDSRMASTYSELILLAELLRDTDLALPEPVPSSTGELVPELWVDGMDSPRQCVLFRWAGIPFPEEAIRLSARWQTN